MPTDGTIKNSGMRSPVLTVVLANEEKFRTGSTGDTFEHVVGPVFEGLGPNVADIVVHVYIHSVSADPELKVKMQYSYDGTEWANEADLLGTTTTTGYHISAVYSAREYFGLYVRFIIEIAKAVGGSGQQYCEVSATAAIRYLS